MLLNVGTFVEIYDAWANAILSYKDELIRLDAVAGDGDLGLAMTDGFNAISKFAHESTLTDLGTFFYNSGKIMNECASSSLGTLISSGLMNAGKAFRGQQVMNGCELGKFLNAFEDGIISRGKAKIGDKTFLDGFDPAVQVMQACTDENNVVEALLSAANAAQSGSAATVGMIAVWGRAARRGEDSRQILDPGSVVAAILVTTLANYFSENTLEHA